MAAGPTLLWPLATALFQRGEWRDRAAVAAAVGVHRATLQPWLDHLAHHRAVRENSGLLVDADRLWAVLTAHRIVAQRPATAFPMSIGVRAASERLEEAEIPHAFCMFSAANQFAFFEPRRHAQVYLPRGHIREARRLLQARSDDSLQVFVETIGTLPVLSRGGVAITNPLLTIADLRAHPEGGAHASFLQEKLLPRVS